MRFDWLVKNWLWAAAEEKLRETLVQAAQDQLAAVCEPAQQAAEPPRACQVGVVVALASEAGGLVDLLADVRTSRGHGFLVHQGQWRQRRVVLMVCGAGRPAAARATEALILAHRPGWVISAGFCGGLISGLQRHDILIADALADTAGRGFELELSGLDLAGLASRPGVHVGRLLTTERIVRRPAEKRKLAEQHRALAADLESLAAAEVCRRHGVRFLAVRVVSDAVDEPLPAEVERLSRQKSRAARWGAAFGAILNRPGAVKDLFKLQQNALVASDRLARFLAGLIEQLVPLPPTGPQ
ncbi:MAG: phosphorylase family protein [Thermoguttaceae bacterium]